MSQLPSIVSSGGSANFTVTQMNELVRTIENSGEEGAGGGSSMIQHSEMHSAMMLGGELKTQLVEMPE